MVCVSSGVKQLTFLLSQKLLQGSVFLYKRFSICSSRHVTQMRKICFHFRLIIRKVSVKSVSAQTFFVILENFFFLKYTFPYSSSFSLLFQIKLVNGNIAIEELGFSKIWTIFMRFSYYISVIEKTLSVKKNPTFGKLIPFCFSLRCYKLNK